MRTVETHVYKFDELDDNAKEKARDWFRSIDMWDSSEWWNSAKEFSDVAPIEIIEADYDNATVRIKWQGDDFAELSGVRAWKWLQNNGWFSWARDVAAHAKLTGFCGDCAFGDPLTKEYEKNPAKVPDLEQVFYEMAQAWVQDARRDLEGSRTDESVDDTIQANEYEFTETGKKY